MYEGIADQILLAKRGQDFDTKMDVLWQEHCPGVPSPFTVEGRNELRNHNPALYDAFHNQIVFGLPNAPKVFFDGEKLWAAKQ